MTDYIVGAKTSTEMIKKFGDSVTALLDQLDVKYDELAKLKESDRTYLFHTKKMITKWFHDNGGL